MELQMKLFYNGLAERDRRHYVAVEAEKLGYGGKAYISELFGANYRTINRGVLELNSPDLYSALPEGKQRATGGGRKKKRFINPPFKNNSMS